jgi:dihydroorotate dehydrogenase electron transfer subunit
MEQQDISSEAQKKLRICEITKIMEETQTIKSFYFEDDVPVQGGQFVMVWIPGVDEIPMSVSYTEPEMGITVAKVGDATAKLHELAVGSKLGIRGPYGNGFNILKSKKILAVAGGCGSAPIGPVLDEAIGAGKDITFLVGARTSSELLFKQRATKLSIPVEVATDDGSEGFAGFVTDRMLELIQDNKFDLVVTCGPEVMLKKVVDIGIDAKIPVQTSLERYMKCGIGICDSCAINGYQVCRDGPVFNGETLAKLDEFGKSHRDGCGRLIGI